MRELPRLKFLFSGSSEDIIIESVNFLRMPALSDISIARPISIGHRERVEGD
jgi:hypothetical protein